MMAPQLDPFEALRQAARDRFSRTLANARSLSESGAALVNLKAELASIDRREERASRALGSDLRGPWT